MDFGEKNPPPLNCSIGQKILEILTHGFELIYGPIPKIQGAGHISFHFGKEQWYFQEVGGFLGKQQTSTKDVMPVLTLMGGGTKFLLTSGVTIGTFLH
jgi:hypothetical protein